jgi:hypothetical protein
MAKKKKAAKVTKSASKPDRPWWGVGHTLWGGETFKSQKKDDELGIKKGDEFRIERSAVGVVTLVPHPNNSGTWRETYGNSNPIVLTEFDPTTPGQERVFSMQVKIDKNSTVAKQLYFIEFLSGAIAISDSATNPGLDDSSVSIER